MPTLIPLNSQGNRTITVDTRGGGLYSFRSYFSMGIYDGWFVDIADSVGTDLLLGIRVVPGCPNLLKGQGDRFPGRQLACVVLSGRETAPDALGNGTYLVWFNPGEVNPFVIGDPLLEIPYDQWAFHQAATNRLFDSDGAGRIFIEGIVLAGTTDVLATLTSGGRISLKPSAAPGAENDYFRIDENGNMAIKG
jgi:hypothetical protein